MFNISKPDVRINAEYLGKGKIRFVAEVINNPSGTEKMEIPVWNEKYWQDDIIWYRADRETDGRYHKEVSIAEHNGEVGNYYYAAYGIAKNGIPISSSENNKIIKIEVNVGNFLAEVNEEETKVRLTLKDAEIEGIGTGIKFAVWSEEKGQDDLRWYTATKDAEENYVYDVKIKDHKTAGQYQAHCYLVGKDGSSTIIKAIVFNIVKKSELHIDSINSYDDGQFTLILKTTTPNLISKIQVPIWCDSNQNDIVWYNATKINDDSYQVIMDIKNHKYHIGQYNIHVYSTLVNDITHIAYVTTENISVSNYMYVERVGYGMYNVNIINPNGEDIESVQIPTWSEENGQDDILWYNASFKGNGLWSAIINTANHKNSGIYLSHFYVTSNGTKTFIGSITYNVPSSDMLVGMNKKAQSYRSATSKLILVDLSNHKVAVYDGKYQNWTNIQQFICTVGAPSTPTITGEYEIYMHRSYFDSGSSRCFYFSPFKGGYGFHSVLYYQDTTPQRIMDGRLGMDLSHGCVRLDVNDAKWIYYNCPIGTKVVIYR